MGTKPNVLTIFLLIILSQAMSCKTPSVVATQSIRQGDLMNNQNNHEEAIRHYEQYLAVAPQLGLYRNPSMEASVYRKLSQSYSTQGKYIKSVDCLKKAIKIDSVYVANVLEFIEDYRMMGVVHGYKGEYHKALAYLSRSLQLNEGMDKSVKDVKKASLADTYMSLAQVHLTLGNYHETESYVRKALDIYTSIPNEKLGIIESTLTLGIVLRDKGKLKEAEKHIIQSKELSIKEKLNVSRHEQALGEIYFLKGNPEEGLRHKLIAIEEAERTKIKPQILISYLRAGDAYQQMGDQKNSNLYYRKAVALQASMGSDTLGLAPSINLRLGDVQRSYHYYMQSGSGIGIALASFRFGESQWAQHHTDSALMMFLQAKKFFKQSGSGEGIARVNLELAKINTENRNFDEARKLLQDAISLTVQPDLKWQVHYRKGIIHELNGNYDSAYLLYKNAINILDNLRGNLSLDEFKAIFSNAKAEVYDRMVMLLLSSRQKFKLLSPDKALIEAFDYSEQGRSRAFLDMMGNNKLDGKATADISLLEQEQELRLKMQQIGKELDKGQADIASRHQLTMDLQRVQDDYHVLVQKIRLNNPAYSTLLNVKPPSLKDVQSSLQEKMALIEYWVSGESIAILVVTRNHIYGELVPISKSVLLREIKGCRTTIGLALEDGVDPMLKKLFSWLIKPILPRIDGIDHLVIVPHKSLHFLPFQALLADDGKFLMEKYIVSYAPSASIHVFCQAKEISQVKNFLGLSLGDYPIDQFPGLPGTETEIKQVAQLYTDVESKSKSDFTEAYLRDNASRFGYLHLATHGVYNARQPLSSFLLMAPSGEDEGKMTVEEIFSLPVNARLVTLSACETGLGDIGEGDELVGMSRAFIYAGSPSVIVSLWKVDDATASALMTRFHQYLSSGNTIAHSLTYAQRDMLLKNFSTSISRGLKEVSWDPAIAEALKSRTSKVMRHPYYWAPFVLIGYGGKR